jgi:hypothetical protein
MGPRENAPAGLQSGIAPTGPRWIAPTGPQIRDRAYGPPSECTYGSNRDRAYGPPMYAPKGPPPMFTGWRRGHLMRESAHYIQCQISL